MLFVSLTWKGQSSSHCLTSILWLQQFTLFLLRSTTTTPLLFPLQTPPNSSFHFLTSFPQIPTSYYCSQTQLLSFQILFFFLPPHSFNNNNNKLFFSRRPISNRSVSKQWRAWKAQTPRGFQVLSRTGIWVIVDSGDEGRGDGHHNCFAPFTWFRDLVSFGC